MRIFFRNLAIALTLSIASVFINHALGFNTGRHDIGDVTRNAVTVLFWCSIFLTIVQMRPLAGAEHDFFMAFRNGFFYSVFYSAIFSAFIAFYQHVINPQFYPTYRAHFEKKLAEAKLAPELLAAKLRQFDMSFNGELPSFVLLFLFMGMGGAIMAAIAGALFRKPTST